MVQTSTQSPNIAQHAQGNYRAIPSLKIDGKEPPKELMEDILQLVVEESLHLPGAFTLVIQNDYFTGRGDKPWRYQDILQIGKTVTIGFTGSTTDSQDFSKDNQGQLIEAEITAIEAHFSGKSQAPIIVRGYDTCHRLHRGQHNRSFQNMTDTDIVKKIAEEAGIRKVEADNSGEPHDYVFQENQTNLQFLRQRASRIGFELFNQDGTLHFRKPKAGKELSLKWLKEVNSFRVRVTSAEQVKEVEARAWDYGEKRAIVSTASTEQLITKTDNGEGVATSSKFSGKPTNPKRIVVDQPAFKPKEVDAIAQAVCNEIAGQFVYADAKAEGNPEIRPGRVIKLEDMGNHSGKYYVTETRHIYQERIYITEFSVRGLRSGDLLSTLAPTSPLEPGQTMLVGIVTDNKDPKGWGRVKVKFPTLTEDHSSNWARVVGVGAGPQRGFDCLPEINDEVLVAFEHGDIHRPYVLGGVWNGKDKPPAAVEDSVQDGKVRLRTIKTRTGHVVQFVEEDGSGRKDGIYIETAGGYKISLNDSEMAIEIVTKGGQKIKLDDPSQTISMMSPGRIEQLAGGEVSAKAAVITHLASGAATVTAGAGIAITAGGALAITAGALTTINSIGVITITAPAIALNGVVTINGKPLPL